MPDARTGTYPRSPLDLDFDTMRRLGYRVTDTVAEHLSTLRTQRVLDTLPRRATERLIAAGPPARGSDIADFCGRLGHELQLQNSVFKIAKFFFVLENRHRTNAASC